MYLLILTRFNTYLSDQNRPAFGLDMAGRCLTRLRRSVFHMAHDFGRLRIVICVFVSELALFGLCPFIILVRQFCQLTS